MDGFRTWLAVLLLGAGLAASRVEAASVPADESAPPRLSISSTSGSALLVAPMLWALGILGLPVHDPSSLPNSCALQRGQGFRRLVFPVHDAGTGVYLAIEGRAEFEAAEIHLADGTCRTIDFGHAARGKGLYQLADFGAMTAVEGVVLSARARSGEAQVGVRLGR